MGPEVTIQQLLSWFGWIGMRVPVNYVSKRQKIRETVVQRLESEIDVEAMEAEEEQRKKRELEEVEG